MYESKWPSAYVVTDDDVREFRQELRKIYQALRQPQSDLRKAARQLLSRPKPDGAQNAQQKALAALKDGIIKKLSGGVRKDGTLDATAVLDRFLDGTKKGVFDSTEAESDRRASSFLRTFPDVRSLMNVIADGIAAEVKTARQAADDKCRKALGMDGATTASASVAVTIARDCLQNYYRNYDDYDMIIFPIVYQTDVGEPSLVDVFRVSPEDATALIDERVTKCHKLAGTSLAHFGAFLEERWRKNDILWGRLDGAERIISAVLPSGHPRREALIGEAQAAIVFETIEKMGRDERNDLLCEAAMRTGSGTKEPNLLVSLDAGQSPGFVDNLKLKATDTLRSQLDSKIDNAALRQRYLDIFATNSTPDPQSTLKTAARATTIMGKMFEKLADDNVKAGKKYAAWVTRVGLIFWGLVELAAPKSIWNLLFRYWLQLLYLVELILVAGGTILLMQRIQQFGLILFGLTLAVHFAVTILNDVMSRRLKWITIGKGIVFILLVAMVAVGVFASVGIIASPAIWRRMEQVNRWFHQPSAWRKWSPAIIVAVLFVVSIRNDLRRAKKRKRKEAEPSNDSIPTAP